MSRFKVGETVFVERGKSYASFKLANRICTIKNVGDINKGLNKRSYSLVEEAELGDSVYRIEHETIPMKRFFDDKIIEGVGNGCYNTRAFSRNSVLAHQHTGDPNHPSIRTDIGNWYSREDYYEKCACACETLESLNTWFRGWKPRLLKENFIVVEYTVKKFTQTKSKKQVMFHPKDIVSKTVIQTKN